MASTSAVDLTRHNLYIDPEDFNGTIDVIGCGATGSAVVQELARLGFTRIRVWDDDEVASHNVANQKFVQADVGTLKVDALAIACKEIADIDIQTMPRKCTGDDRLGEVVFLLTDTMSSRKEIGRAIEDGLRPQLVIETRMGADEGSVYVVDPRDRKAWAEWKDSLCEDGEGKTGALWAKPSECGAKVVIGSTASILAGLAVRYMVDWLKWSLTPKDQPGRPDAPPPNETLFTLAPKFSVVTQDFDYDNPYKDL